MKRMPPGPLVTIKDIARRCNCSERSVSRWLNDPLFPERFEDYDIFSGVPVVKVPWHEVEEYLQATKRWDFAVNMPDVNPHRGPTLELGL